MISVLIGRWKKRPWEKDAEDSQGNRWVKIHEDVLFRHERERHV